MSDRTARLDLIPLLFPPLQLGSLGERLSWFLAGTRPENTFPATFELKMRRLEKWIF